MQKNKAFTLVELIIVIVIMATVLPVIASSLFVTVRSQIKVARITNVKTKGDNLINTISQLLQNKITSIKDSTNTNLCQTAAATQLTSTATKQIALIDDSANNYYSFSVLNGGELNFFSCQGSICNTQTSTPQSLVFSTADQLEVSTFSITCQRQSANPKPIYKVNFTLQTKNYTNISNTQAKAKLDFFTTVVARR